MEPLQLQFFPSRIGRQKLWDNVKNTPWKTMERAPVVGHGNQLAWLFIVRPLLGTIRLR
jgi:hypothetical protein